MRGIDRNRKGANHASSRQYPVDHSWWVGHRNRMGIGGTDSVHLHHRRPARHSSVQDGGTHPDARLAKPCNTAAESALPWPTSCGWCWSAGGWRSAIWEPECSTASPLSVFRSDCNHSRWPSLRSGRSARKSSTCRFQIPQKPPKQPLTRRSPTLTIGLTSKPPRPNNKTHIMLPQRPVLAEQCHDKGLRRRLLRPYPCRSSAACSDSSPQREEPEKHLLRDVELELGVLPVFFVLPCRGYSIASQG